jgi:hypothetical protein
MPLSLAPGAPHTSSERPPHNGRRIRPPPPPPQGSAPHRTDPAVTVPFLHRTSRGSWRSNALPRSRGSTVGWSLRSRHGGPDLTFPTWSSFSSWPPRSVTYFTKPLFSSRSQVQLEMPATQAPPQTHSVDVSYNLYLQKLVLWILKHAWVFFALDIRHGRTYWAVMSYSIKFAPTKSVLVQMLHRVKFSVLRL